MKNTQPKGTQRWAISNIIGDKKLFKLEAAGFKVVSRDDLRKKQNKLRELTEVNTLLSNLIGQMADLLIVAHPTCKSRLHKDIHHPQQPQQSDKSLSEYHRSKAQSDHQPVLFEIDLSEFDSDKPFESLLEILEKIIPQKETK